jgi:hypothetical protein
MLIYRHEALRLFDMSTYDIDKDYDLWLEEQVNYLRDRAISRN